MTVKFFLCAASGKKCDRKRKIKDEIALKISFSVGTIQICSFSSYSNVNVCTCTVYYDPISVTMYLRVCQSSVQH